MNLSNRSLNELFKKCESKFTKFAGKSTDLAVWQAFYKKNPVEFRGKLNGADIILKIAKDGYAIAYPNPMSSFSVYSFDKTTK